MAPGPVTGIDQRYRGSQAAAVICTRRQNLGRTMFVSDPLDDGSPGVFDTGPSDGDSNTPHALVFGVTDPTPTATEGQSL
jgi:hypothetical protein